MKVKVCEYNLENLFISMEYYNGEDLQNLREDQWRSLALSQLQRYQKPLFKVFGLAETIRDIDPDILMLTEVGGRDSIDFFCQHFLNGQYTPHFVEGNSRRNIDLAFLVKTVFPLTVEPISNKETPIEVTSFQGKYQARFSRDVAELRIYDRSELKLILLLTHLKSQISTEQDFRGKDVRTAEAHALANLYRSLRSSHPQTPIIVGGDFNANLSSLELEILNYTDLSDFHDLLNTPFEDRVSLVHFDFQENPHLMVLDYLLISPHLKDRIVPQESFTYRYKGFYDIPLELPKSWKERSRLPSDHYPVVLTLDL